MAAVATKVFWAALTFLAAHPVIAALMAVGAIIGGIILVVRNLSSTEDELDDNRERQHQAHLQRLEAERKARQEQEASVRRIAALEKRLADIREREAAVGMSKTQQEIAAIRKLALEKRRILQRLAWEEQQQKGGMSDARHAELVAESIKVAEREADAIQKVLDRYHARKRSEEARETDKALREAARARDRSLEQYKRRTGYEGEEAVLRMRYERFMEKQRKRQKQGQSFRTMGFEEFAETVTEGRWGQMLRGGIEAKGSFNASAMLGLQAGGPAERTAKAADQIAKNTKKIVENTKTPLAFA